MDTGYTVQQVMRTKVLTAEPDMKIVIAAKLMAEKGVGSLVVLNKNKVAGILTEQDLSRKVLARGVDPNTTQISKVMSNRVYTISPDKDIYDAMVEMGKRKIKHLPVVIKDKLVGIVSFKDIISIEPDLIDLLSFKSSLTDKERRSVFFK